VKAAPFSNFTVCFGVIVTGYYFMLCCTYRQKSESECQILRGKFASKSCRRL